MVSVPITWSDRVVETPKSNDRASGRQDGIDREFSSSLADMADIPWPFDGVQRSRHIPISVTPYPDGFCARWNQSWYPLDDIAPCWSPGYVERPSLMRDPFNWLTAPCMNPLVPLPAHAHPEGYPAADLDELRWSETRLGALRERIAHLEATIGAAQQDGEVAPQSARDRTSIATSSFEFEASSGEMRGVSIKDLVVRAVDDAGSAQGWRVGDRILQLNGYPVSRDEDLETALVFAHDSYRLAGKAPVFEIQRVGAAGGEQV